MQEAQLRTVNSYLRLMIVGYYWWYFVYLVLGLGSIVLPGLAVMKWPSAEAVPWMAGAGSLAAAMFGFLKPHEYATGFDAATQTLLKVKASLQLGKPGEEGVVAEIHRAIDYTTFKYGNLINVVEAERKREH